MKADIRFESDSATVIVADEGVIADVRTRDIAEAEPLRQRAKAGEAFLVDAEDPRLGHIHVYLDEPVPEEIEAICSEHSGSFLLRVPSGRLSVCALGTGSPETREPPEKVTIDVPPGDYSVSVLDGSTKDIPALVTQEEALVGSADWRVHQRIDQVGALGCLIVAAGMVFVLVPYTRRNFWYLLPLFLLPSCAYSLLRRLPRYRRVEERCQEYEDGLPQYVLTLKRVDTTEGLEGGWYQSK